MDEKLLGKCGFYCGVCENFPCDAIMTKPHSTVLDKNWLAWKKKVRGTDNGILGFV